MPTFPLMIPLPAPSRPLVLAKAAPLLLALLPAVLARAQTSLDPALEARVIEWRRDIHEHPELSNRETRTAALVAEHLRGLGMEVRTGIAHTGVVGVLEGGRPGPVVGLRADMDALPVTETADVPFRSTARDTFRGKDVGVMHACGHDTHVAMLMGAAEKLAGMGEELAGTVVFVFQPAEEGAPPGEEGGASLMVREGVLDDPEVDVMFGAHINSQTPAGTLRYKPKGTMAASDPLRIVVAGRQAHGAYPWKSIDPIVAAAHIITAMQTVVSRNTPLTKAAAVVTIGKIDGGVRGNIIPDTVELIGTIRTLDTAMRRELHADLRRVVTHTAEATGATATVEIGAGNPVTYNDPALTARMLPTLERTAGAGKVELQDAVTGAEDFSYYAERVPSLFVFVGGMDPSKEPEEVAPHHTPDFYIDERGLRTGVELYVNLATDYLAGE